MISHRAFLLYGCLFLLENIHDMPTKRDEMKAAIQSVIRAMMDRVMENVLINDPFIEEAHRAKRPLYAALVPDEIFKGSHFERRFVTPFGKAWELLAVTAANKGLGYGVAGHVITGTVTAERLRRITEVLNRLEHAEKGQKRTKPDWKSELAYVLAGEGEPIPVTVICDVYAEDNRSGKGYAFELKAPLPNSDQSKVSKEKILKLYSMEPRQVDGAYYALPYNPYGRRADYAWSFPARWFNMKEDEVVLIGDEFWDKIGGPGTYQSFIKAVNEIGKDYRERIYREFLGIEPPDDVSGRGL
jgi:Type II restriction endonuclease, TdeIII